MHVRKKPGMKKPKEKRATDKIFELVFNAVKANQVTQILELAKKYKEQFKTLINSPIPESILADQIQPRLLLFACNDVSISYKTIETLLDVGADINFSSQTNTTALLLATRQKRADIVSLLLEKDVSLSINPNHPISTHPLSVACEQGDLELASKLILMLRGNDANISEVINTIDANGDSILANAYNTGHVHIVAYLLATTEEEDNSSAYFKKNPLPLCIAAQNGHTEIFSMLIKAGADINLPSRNGTAIENAVKNNHISLIETLIGMGALLRQSLLYAVLNKRLDIIEMLLNAGADVNQVVYIEKEAQTILEIACCHCELKIVKLLFPKANLKENNFLFNAIASTNIELVKFLLESGIDVNQPLDKGGSTALNYAFIKNHEGIIQICLEKGAVHNSKHLSTAIHTQKLNLVKLLIDKNSDVNTKLDSGLTPLSLACSYPNLQIVKELLKAGAKPSGELYYAAVKNKFELLKLLVGYSDVNQVCEKGRTLLGVISGKGNLEMVQVLIANGANVNSLSEGVTPLSKAIDKGDIDVVNALIVAGADVNQAIAGITPLLKAVASGKINIVELLVEQPNINLYKTVPVLDAFIPLSAASRCMNLRMVDLLLKAGKKLNQNPTPDLLRKIFNRMLIETKDQKQVLEIMQCYLSNLTKEEIINVFFPSNPDDSPLKKLADVNYLNKKFFVKFFLKFMNYCKEKIIYFPENYVEQVLSLGTKLELRPHQTQTLLSLKKPITQTGNESSSHIQKEKEANLTIQQLESTLLAQQKEGIISVIPNKSKIEETESKKEQIIKAVAENKKAEVVTKNTWFNGLLTNVVTDKEKEIPVIEIENTTNQYFFCTQEAVNDMDSYKVTKVFGPLMAFPKQVGPINEAGFKGLYLQAAPIVSVEMTSNSAKANGEVNKEIKSEHAQYAKARFFCASILSEQNQATLVVPIKYDPDGLHETVDDKSLNQSLKSKAYFEISIPTKKKPEPNEDLTPSTPTTDQRKMRPS